jgi:hypothetical protein
MEEKAYSRVRGTMMEVHYDDNDNPVKATALEGREKLMISIKKKAESYSGDMKAYCGGREFDPNPNVATQFISVSIDMDVRELAEIVPWLTTLAENNGYWVRKSFPPERIDMELNDVEYHLVPK